jgi:hypothetical protein
VNSEELERSLRAEFESYLKNVVASIREEVVELQRSFESEFDKHRAQMDEAFRSISSRLDAGPEFDAAFTESVVEHLRLARDEGATITAAALGEAERLAEESAAPTVQNYSDIRDAVNDISTKRSQAEILKTLVDHASRFAGRGAFFIVKNGYFVGWKAFGHDALDESAVREIHFPVTDETLLASAVETLLPVSGQPVVADESYLRALGFSRPEHMIAVPLTARGRGVAVLFADDASTGVPVNADALEAMVRVAGLTVELLAAGQTSPHSGRQEEADKNEQLRSEETEAETVEAVQTVEVAEEYAAVTQDALAEAEVAEEVPSVVYDDSAVMAEAETQTVADTNESYEPGGFEFRESDAEVEAIEVEDRGELPEVQAFPEESTNGHASGAEPEFEAVSEPEPDLSPSPTAEPMVEVAGVTPMRSRLSDRNVDLPIEVPEEERRVHNDARRFARLLVSEIKLYNEEKVAEGRESGDLYDRLREAIDRSREMYAKRAQPSVASRFDYFHYELVNSLAEGDHEKLGASYPGSLV